jgi:hypothetical protein
MFAKSLTSFLNDMAKYITVKTMLVLVVLVGIWMYYSSYITKYIPFEKMEGGDSAQSKEQKPEVKPAVVASTAAESASGYSVQSVANPSDLFPVDENSKWAALNPNALTNGQVATPDLLKAGYHIGLDTIGQSLRNASWDLRPDPVIPKADVGPWNQSTIENNYPARDAKEIGERK